MNTATQAPIINPSIPVTTPNTNPYRSGFCDGIFGRPCKSPWSNSGFKSILKNADYINGYMTGEEAREKIAINLTKGA